LGEEDDESTRDDTSPVPDFLWVLDPLDGTKNFVHGLPVYASSVGVLFKGAPVAGAVFIPWPGAAEGGLVFHARKGGGAFVDGQPLSVLDSEEPKGNVLITLPAGFGAFVGFRKPMMGKVGELRVTGSIAYELVMVARGISQYMVTTGPRLWDVAGGVALVMEAGGVLMRGSRDPGPLGLFPSTRWQESESLVPDWQSGKTSLGDLRRWRSPLTLGSPRVARFVTANMRRRTNLRRRLIRRIRGLRPRRRKVDAQG
jgi:myo-inositol-1(or 4)-monophosphatase